MATRVELLALGQSMEEGTVTAWHKSEGDAVTQGEPLYNVMTDKADFEQEAPASGILRKILVPADDIAPVGALLAIIGSADEAIDSLLGASASTSAAVAAPTTEEPLLAAETFTPDAAADSPSPIPAPTGRLFISPRARRAADQLGIDVANLAGIGTGIDGRVVEADVVMFNADQVALRKSSKVTPLAHRVASDQGVDVASLAGSGSGHAGKVTSGDVLRAATPAPTTKPSAATSGDDEVLKVIPLSGMRKMIADNVARSAQTAPHVTLVTSVDMSSATAFRKQVLASFEKSQGVRISFTDIIAKAVARSLQDHPAINSTLVDGKITQYKSVHLGIAVSLGEGGLVVPTLRNAESKTLPEISQEIKSLAGKSRDGKLGLDEMIGGTFSITNLGTYGVESFNPVINPPQCAILGVCTIKDTIVPVDGEAKIRPMMNLCLSFDHRITDGAPAAAFLARLKEVLETPYLIFM